MDIAGRVVTPALARRHEVTTNDSGDGREGSMVGIDVKVDDHAIRAALEGIMIRPGAAQNRPETGGIPASATRRTAPAGVSATVRSTVTGSTRPRP